MKELLFTLMFLTHHVFAQNYAPNCNAPTNVFSGKQCSASAPDIINTVQSGSWGSTSIQCRNSCRGSYTDTFAVQWQGNPNRCTCIRSASMQGTVTAGTNPPSGSVADCTDCRHTLPERGDLVVNGNIDIKDIGGTTNGWDPLSVDVYGSKLVMSARGYEGSFNGKSVVWVYDLANLTGNTPLHTITDPDDLTNPSNDARFGEKVFISSENIIVTARHTKKIYIYDSYTYALVQTIDGSGFGTQFPLRSYGMYKNGPSIDFDKMSRVIVVKSTTSVVVIKKQAGGTWTISSRAAGTGSSANSHISISYGGRWIYECDVLNSNFECAIYNPSETGVIGDKIGGFITSAFSFTKPVIITNTANPSSTPRMLLVQDDSGNMRQIPYSSSSFSTSNTKAINCFRQGSAVSTVPLVYDPSTNYLYSNAATTSNAGRCIIRPGNSASANPSVLTYVNYLNYATTNQFGTQSAIDGNTAVFVSPRTTTSPGSKVIGVYFAHDFIIPPPTVSPTMSPTPAPTFECTETAHCTEPNEICGDGNSCGAHPCLSHGDCYGVMLPGRLGRCSGGFCVDSYSGSCVSSVECTAKVNRMFVSENSLGQREVQVSNSNISKVVEATKGMINEVFNSSTEDLFALLDGDYSATFSRVMWDLYNDDDALLLHIKTIICGDVPCTISKGTGRRLQNSGEVGVFVSFTIDSILLDQLTKVNAFEDPQFIQDLAAAAGLNETDVVITTSSGTIVLTLQVAKESTGDDPLEDENIGAIEAVTSSLGAIADSLIQTLSLPPDAISISSVDKCAGRDCNGRGTCSPTTGICNCQQGWWGVNCETAVVCVNGGVTHPTSSYCMCPYPFWGKRCVSTKDECSAGNCV